MRNLQPKGGGVELDDPVLEEEDEDGDTDEDLVPERDEYEPEETGDEEDELKEIGVDLEDD